MRGTTVNTKHTTLHVIIYSMERYTSILVIILITLQINGGV